MRRLGLLLCLLASPALAADDDPPGCVRVQSVGGWQGFDLPSPVGRVTAITGGWSVDIRNYPRIGAAGHDGEAAEKLSQWNYLKYDEAFAFGHLLARQADGAPEIALAAPGPLPSRSAHWEFRINDREEAQGDNEGELCVCLDLAGQPDGRSCENPAMF